MVEPAPQCRPSILMDVMFGLTIAALFAGIHQNIGPAKVQLSDLLAIVTILLAGLQVFASPQASLPLVLILAGYLLIVSISALFVGLANGIKEIVQNILVFSFIFVAFAYYRTRPTQRLLAIAATLIFMILVYNIVWHVAQGEYVGWKRLNEPKTVFLLLPLLLILCFDRFGTFKHRSLTFVVVVAVALIVLLSGERKAYVFAPLAAAIWIGPGNWRVAVAAAVLIPCMWFAASVDRTGYLARQLGSFTNPASGSTTESVLFDSARPVTMSNAQREFSNRLALAKWKKEPIFGMGTNAFTLFIAEDASIPEKFRRNVHGEFYRALYENGIVGLFFYCMLWIAAFAKVAFMWPLTRAVGDSNLNKIKLSCIFMFLLYCAFEASKGLTLFCICVLPFLVALPPRPAVRSA